VELKVTFGRQSRATGVCGVNFDKRVPQLYPFLYMLVSFTVMTAVSRPALRARTVLDGSHPVVFPIIEQINGQITV